MRRTPMRLSLALAFAVCVAGCTTATVRVRQPDGTYKTTKELVWTHEVDGSSYSSFECQEDYMVATDMWDVTYEWPKGTGRLTDDLSTVFEGKGIHCEARKRSLTLNGKHYGEFAKGDRVRITPDARVLVNGVEQAPATVN